MSERPLRLLLIEDNPDDADLLLIRLADEGHDLDARRVESLDDLDRALAEGPWAAVICDYSLPGFEAPEALARVRAADPECPFLVISGHVDEENAVSLLRAGAQDFISKNRLARLGPALSRELYEARERRERRAAEQSLRENEQLLARITRTIAEGLLVIDGNGRLLFMNSEAVRLLGWRPDELMIGSVCARLFPEDLRQAFRDVLDEIAPRHMGRTRLVRQDGSLCPVSLVVSALVEGEQARGLVIAFQDITRQLADEAALSESRAQLRALSAFLLDVREKEQTRIARELHDELGQLLTAMKFDLSWLETRLEDERMRVRAERVRGLIDMAVDGMRRIASDLRPGLLDDLGLGAALEWLIEGFSERCGTQCVLEMAHDDFELSEPVATAAYRIVQECLSNIERHARATQCRVRVEIEEHQLRIEVGDDGQGMTPGAPHDDKRCHYGLLGMRERAFALGGELQIDSAPGQGTRLYARLPLSVLDRHLTHKEKKTA